MPACVEEDASISLLIEPDLKRSNLSVFIIKKSFFFQLSIIKVFFFLFNFDPMSEKTLWCQSPETCKPLSKISIGYRLKWQTETEIWKFPYSRLVYIQTNLNWTSKVKNQLLKRKFPQHQSSPLEPNHIGILLRKIP